MKGHGAMNGPTVLHVVVLLDDKGMYVRREKIHHFFKAFQNFFRKSKNKRKKNEWKIKI